MSRILCVGVATLDIVNRVEAYPAEDSEVRASAQSQRMGGNAANTAIVLAQLGERVSWVGNLPRSAALIDQTFARHGVDATHARRIADAVLPTSYILLSAQTGSRSIVHYRDMPEYCADDFATLDLDRFDWIHFEGRAVDQLGPMLRRARDTTGIRISLEVEKPRPAIEALFDLPDLLLFSPDYARTKGYSDAQGLLGDLPRTVVATCTWGESGAWAVDRDGKQLHAAAPVLDQVVDTVGAGDAFNAAILHALAGGQSLERALHAAVALASAKCSRDGLVLA